MTDGDRKTFFSNKIEQQLFYPLYKHHGSMNHDDFMKHRLDGIIKVKMYFQKYQSFSFPVNSKNRS